MSISYGDLANLEQQLVTTGRDFECTDEESLICDADDWYQKESDSGIRDVVLPESFTRLCEYSRERHGARVSDIARGSLSYVRDHHRDNPDKCRFVVRFALGRIQALSGHGPLWSGMEIREAERLDAEALFEAARGDKSYTDEELFDAVHEFVDNYGGRTGLFGRLAHDLTLLTEYLANESADPLEVETARAALSYFSVVSDAIPDNLGPVGLVDDMYVINRAIMELCPMRGALIAYMDGVMKRWPFINQLVLESGGSRHRAAEYVLVNIAMLIDELGDQVTTPGTIVVVPEVGPLPLLAGFVGSVAEITSKVADNKVPELKYDDRLIDMSTKKVVIFRRFLKVISGITKMVPCQAGEADYFQFTELKLKSKGDEVEHKYPIKRLSQFRRCGKDKRIIKGAELGQDSSEVEVGALERLVGSVSPIIMPSELGHVVVIGQLGYLRDMVEQLMLFGTPLRDVVPTGRVYVDEAIELKNWSAHGLGGDPALVFVRAADEAAELVEDSDLRINAVVAACRPNSTDMSNLKRIASDGVRVLVFAEERDLEVLDYVGDGEFSIWAWDEESLGQLHWAEIDEKCSGPLAVLERRARSRANSRVDVVEFEIRGLSEASEALSTLNRELEQHELSPITLFVGEGLVCLTRMCRMVCVDYDDVEVQVRKHFSEMRRILHEFGIWLTEDMAELTTAVLGGLSAAFEALRESNPKLEYIRSWARGVDKGNLVVGNGNKDGLEDEIAKDGVSVGMPRGHSHLEQEAVVSGWFGKDRMSRLLIPPMSATTHLLVYGPEKNWYHAFLNRWRRHAERTRQFRRDHPPFSDLSVRPKKAQVWIPDNPHAVDYPDEIITTAKRRRVTNVIDASTDETEEAHIVHFAGDAWGVFRKDHKVNVLMSAVRDSVEVSHEDLSIRMLPVKDLESGDMVLMLRGSDSEVIRERVDEMPGSRELRHVAREWQMALERYHLIEGVPYETIRAELAAVGCKRSLPTVRKWVRDESMIGPRHGRRDIEAILEVTGDDRLGSRVDKCDAAISRLKGLHQHVAMQLSKAVIDRARRWIVALETPEEIVEIDERLILVSVESVDTNLVDAPKGLLNRLQENT